VVVVLVVDVVTVDEVVLDVVDVEVVGGEQSVSAQLATSATMRTERRVDVQRAGRRMRQVRRPLARRSRQQTTRPDRPHVERRSRRRHGRRNVPPAIAARMMSRVQRR
jgi:hypothetical protein